MDAGGMEKDCSALGGLFHTIMTDMKECVPEFCRKHPVLVTAQEMRNVYTVQEMVQGFIDMGGYPVWEDFISKTTKLQSHLRTTIVIAGAFLDAFQKVADLATNTRGATKEIGSALTRMCMRHRSIESRLKQLTVALTDGLINPLELRIEEWKKIANQLDKDHAKEYKKARQEIKKKSSDTLKLQKKVKKGKEDVRLQLDSALQDVNEKYALLEDTEKQAVCRALIEERSRFCTFVSLLRPVLGEEISMLGEVTHLQTILDDLTILTAEPQTLPPASEQVIVDLKVTDDYNYTYHTPPSSPSTTLSRRGTLTSSSSQCLPAAGRHAGIPSFDPVTASLSPPPAVSVGIGGQDRCVLPSLDRAHTNAGQKQGSVYPSTGTQTTHTKLEAGVNQYTDRPRAMTTTASCKPALGEMSAREHLALALGHGPSGEAPGSSRDSLHCSSGYSTQTTTPSCSEDTIPSHPVKKDHELIDYDCVSLHGEREMEDHITFDKSSTIPRNSDLAQNYRRMFQEKRPASTVSLLTEPEARFPSHVATIRRKPSSKPSLRRGTISGVPIPIRPPVVPMPPPPVSCKPAGLLGARTTSEEWVGVARKQGSSGSTLSLSYPSPYPLSCSAPYSQSHPSAPSPYPQPHPSVSSPYPQSHLSAHSPTYPQSHPSAHSPTYPQPCGLHQLPHSLSFTQPSAGTGLSMQPPPAVITQGGGNSSVTVTAPSPSNTDDVLSLIRRGVKLRKTFTNDRSAPKIM